MSNNGYGYFTPPPLVLIIIESDQASVNYKN